MSPIADRGSTIRKRSDFILKRLITPVVEPLGYVVIRADRVVWPGSVPEQIRRLALGADLVIADLTGANPNVLYELGLRHGVGKPSVQIVEQGSPIPFDVAHLRTIIIDSSSIKTIQRSLASVTAHVVTATASALVETALPSDETLAAYIDGQFSYETIESAVTGVSGTLPKVDPHDRRQRELGPQSQLPRWLHLDREGAEPVEDAPEPDSDTTGSRGESIWGARRWWTVAA